MDKIIYLYGSARDAGTRALRRGVYPREKQIRLGPWVIRPSRRVAVETVRVAPHIVELERKVREGALIVQRADSTVIDIQELVAHCTATPPSSGAALEAAREVMAAIIDTEPMVFPGAGDPTAVPAVLTEPAAEPAEVVAEATAVTAEEVPAVEGVIVLAPETRSMPEGWEALTAKELAAVCTEKGIASAKTTKTALVAAVTAWLGGE
jgi:hypothetical protein